MDGTVVNGDCYWLSPEVASPDLLWLAVAVGNSRFICDFYDRRFNNRLYGGRRRFITQYVRHFPLPDPALPGSAALVRLARRAHALAGTDASGEVQAEIDQRVAAALGVQ